MSYDTLHQPENSASDRVRKTFRLPHPAFRLRVIQFMALIVFSALPVLILDGWVQRSALQKEIASVSEKHLLIAQNVSGALSRYIIDIKEAFKVVSDQANARGDTGHLVSLLRALDFNHACIVDGSKIQVNFLATAGAASESPLPDAATMSALRKIAEKAGGKVVITDIMRDRGEPALFVVRQIDARNMALGALGLDYIRKVQRSISFGRRGHSMIVDAQGVVMAHPNKQWENESKDASKLSIVGKMMRGETGVATFYSPPIQANMIAGHTIVPETGWGVMVPQPMSELEDRAGDTQKVAISITAVCIFVAALIGWWLANYLTQPIIAVERAASAVAAGHLNTQVEPLPKYSPIELRHLAAGFNNMVDELRRRDDELRVATTQAKAANRAKSEFLANMSHELRTPLNAILGFSEIIESQTYGPIEQQRYVEYAGDIHSSGEHLLDLINDVLDVAKIEAGVLKPEIEDVDLPRVIQSCLNMIENRALRGNIAVRHDVPPDIPILRGDERMIRQILLNLLANSVKFTPGGGTISIAAVHEQDGGISITVSDTGIGIAPEHIDEVAQPFRQVDNSLHRKYEGTGLGLFLTKTMTELHGAEMHIVSRIGEGTSVIVRFPKEAVA